MANGCCGAPHSLLAIGYPLATPLPAHGSGRCCRVHGSAGGTHGTAEAPDADRHRRADHRSPPAGRGGGPCATSSSLTKFFPRLARLPFDSVERLACFSFFVLLAFFSRTGGATCVHGQVGAPRPATRARLRARSLSRCAVAARSPLA